MTSKLLAKTNQRRLVETHSALYTLWLHQPGKNNNAAHSLLFYVNVLFYCGNIISVLVLIKKETEEHVPRRSCTHYISASLTNVYITHSYYLVLCLFLFNYSVCAVKLLQEICIFNDINILLPI